jgi:hypothetical protein
MDLEDSRLDQQDKQTEKADCRIWWLAPCSDRLPCVSEPELIAITDSQSERGEYDDPLLNNPEESFDGAQPLSASCKPPSTSNGGRCR